jgi:hypothetical protein
MAVFRTSSCNEAVMSTEPERVKQRIAYLKRERTLFISLHFSTECIEAELRRLERKPGY